ncbi:hypothetical protein ACROYT_G009086 [Oculina patagonica]
MATSSSSGSKPPPLPPRPQAQSSSSGLMYGGSRYGYGGSMYGGYSGMYGGGMGGYGMYGGGYGGYGSYGGYGMGMNRFGSPMNQSGTSSFVGRAEESSRAAFQSIESIVQAFGSVAMMLESTHFAMHNTFLAVLSMADHFSRLRTHLVSALGAFTLFKAIRYVFRKVRALLGFAPNQALEEELWNSATTAVASAKEGGDSKKPRSWPILLFFAVVLGTPLIIWKLLQSLLNDENNTKDWKTGEGDHVIARAEYDFDGESEEELSFRAGDILRLAPKGKQPRIRGWLLGTVDGSSEGIVPANYVKILGLRRAKKETKGPKKGSSEEPQEPQTEQTDANTDQEFDKIMEKTDDNSLLPSQNLLTEDPLNERTLVDDDLLDADLQNFNEGQT